MKNQTITTSLNFTSDVSDAISGLKKLREQMGNLTTDQSIFGNVDKEFEKVQKAMRDLAAKKEFTRTSKGAAEYKKILDSITISANKIGQELTQIGANADGAFKFKNVQQAQRVLIGLESNLKLVNKGLKDAQRELSTGLKNLGINEITAKTLQGEQAVTEELRRQYELRRFNYINLAASQRAGIASKLSNSVRKINTTSIVDPGTDKFKGTAADTVQSSIQTALAEGIKQSRTWEQVQLKILEDLNRSQIVVQNIDKILEPIKNDFQEAALKAGTEADNVRRAREEVEALGRFGRDGAFQFSESAQSAINLANSVDRAKQSQTDLKGQIEAAKQSIQQEGQIGQQSLNQITIGTEQAVQQTKNFVNAEHQATDSINEQNKEQEKLDKSMSNMQGWIVNILSIGNAWRKFTQIIRQTFNDVQKLDKAFASIAMVTDKTIEGLWSTYDQYADMANRLGQSTESAIKASALFYQQGLDTADALRLTEDTMKLATLAGADFETATQQMTAALRGFHMEMEEGSRVTDVYSELAAHAAADVNGIAYAMSKTASIASSAGMDFETTAAFITNMIETTQEAPENIGTAMKTIIARFTELKENVSDVDSEFEDLDYNKVDKALKSVGINIKDAQGQFRNLDDVFLELSAKWDTLDRNTQRYIATIAAGSRQQSRFIAMMEDYDRTMELVETAQNSAGRSSEQFAKYQDTVEYKLNQLKNAWEELRVTMIDSDIFKDAIDSLTKFVKSVSKIDFKRLIVMTPIVIPMVKQFVQLFIQGIQNSVTDFAQVGKIIGNAIQKSFSNISTSIVKKLTGVDLQPFENKVKQTKDRLNELLNIKANIDLKREDLTGKLEEAQVALNKFRKDFPIGDEDELELKNLELQEAELTNEINKLEQELKELNVEEGKNAVATKKAGDAADKAGEQYQREAQKIGLSEEVIAQRSQQISSSLQMVGTAAITCFAAIASGADAADAFKAFAVTMAMQGTQLIAQLVATSAAATSTALAEGASIGAALGTGLNAGLAATGIGMTIVAIGAAIGAIILGIISLAKWAQEKNKSLSDQVAEAKTELEEIEDLQKQENEDAKSKKTTADSTQNMIDRYDQLSIKAMKTTKEQEEWNQLIADINEQFPEIVSSYDEANNKISIQRDMWQEISDLQKESAKDAQKSASIATGASIGLKRRIAQLELQEQNESKAEELGLNPVGGISKRSYLQNNVGYQVDAAEAQRLIETLELNTADIQKAFGVDTSNYVEADERWLDFYEMLKDENSEGWDNVYLQLEQIRIDNKTANEKQLEYYDELEKQNISNYLQAGGTDKNIADFIASGAKSQKNSGRYNDFILTDDDFGKEWSSLDKEKKEILNTLNITVENWKDISKDLQKDKDWQAEYAAAAETYNEELIATLASGKLTSNAEELITQYMTEYASMSQEELERLEEKLNSEIFGMDEEAQDTMTKALAEYKEKHKEERQGYVDNLSDILEKNAGYFEKWTIDELEAFNNKIQDAINNFGGAGGAQYIKDLQDNVFKDINQTKINQALGAINWSNATALNWDEFREESIEKLKEIGIKGAEAFFDDWAEQEKRWGNITLSIQNEEDFEKFMQDVDDTIDKISGARADIAELSSKVAKGEKLNLDDYDAYAKKIEEMGLKVEDYLKIDSNGNIIANAEKLKTIYSDAYDEQIKLVKAQIDGLAEDQKNRKSQIKLIHQANLDEIEGRKYIDEQTAAIIEGNKQLAQRLMLSEDEATRNRGKKAYEKAEKELFNIEEKSREKRVKARNEENERYHNQLVQLNEEEKARREELIKKLAELENRKVADMKMYLDAYEEGLKQDTEAAEELTEANDKLAESMEKVADAQEKVNEALEKIKEKEQDVIDKTDELNKILYGDELHKNKLDAMYNYSTALDAITTRTSRAKSSLESYNGKEDVSALMQTYMQGTHAEVVNRSAQNEVIAASIRNYEQVLSSRLAEEISSMNAAHGSHMSTNISDYVSKNGDVTAVNFQALNAAQLPDEISDYVEECVETINNLQKQIDDNTEAIKQKEKEIRDMRKNALQRRVNLEKEVADVLKKQAEDEVKTQKDKYDALKDADDDYLNALEQAINKERELRERNKEWNDLATKEKKLSLMQRDTSGANAKEVMSLEQDVQDTRENLLDKTIDDIIKGMKEMYELQQESREKELEYQEAMMESTEWIKQATAIIDGWTTSDEMVTWFIQHATDEYTEGSAAVQELMRMGWEDTGNQMVADSEILSQDMSDLAVATHEEISQTVIETSETLTQQADFSLQSIIASTEDAITKGEQALEDAIREVQNARDDYREAVKELEEAEAAARQAEEDARKAQQDAEEQRLAAAAANGVGVWTDGTSSNNLPYDQMPQAVGGTLSDTADPRQVYWQRQYNNASGAARTAIINAMAAENFHIEGNGLVKKYATGGLVDYTGPAWVDGTQDEPEAFLSAEDTKRIGQAAELLSSLPFFSGGSINNSVNNGDSLIEVHINIENISSDVDLDNALDKMKNAIWEAANPAGSSVILSK